MHEVEYVGPRVTPRALFAAKAPACPVGFAWNNPEPEPMVPSYSDLSPELKNLIEDDPNQFPPELVDWFKRKSEAAMARDAWKVRDEFGRQVAWRWFWAGLMLQQAPASEFPALMAPPTAPALPPIPRSPLIIGALEAFAIERARQVHEKGYMPAHDDEHVSGELAAAACWYALPMTTLTSLSLDAVATIWPKGWRIPESSPRPTIQERKRELEKAGALLVAEWERIDRLARAEAAE